jgi:hypothetical protein
MKIYLVRGYIDCCECFIGIFADQQAANEVADLENENYESGCHVYEIEVLQSKQHWIEKEQEFLKKLEKL